MSAHDRTEPVYMISVVASLTEMHPQTIRLYDRMGLVNPQRKNKNRLYSEADVDRLKQIRRLTQDMGVNLAGVEVILEMMDRLRILQGENESLIDRCREIEDGVREYLARTGGKVPWLDKFEPLPSAKRDFAALPTPPNNAVLKQIGPPPYILPPNPRQLSAKAKVELEDIEEEGEEERE